MIGGSAPDPYAPMGASFVVPSSTGRTLSDPRLADGENTAVLVLAGQSNICSTIDGHYTIANTGKVDNLDVWSGATYTAAEPLLGCQYFIDGRDGHFSVRLADKLIDGGLFDRVILVPVGVGGTIISQWTVGGAYYPRLAGAARRCAAVGLPVTAYLWMLGGTDAGIGTSKEAMQTGLSDMIAGVRAEGFDAPWFIGLCSYVAGVSSADIRSAQSAVVNNSDIFQGADTDTLTGSTYRQLDDTHMNTTGADATADLWKSALDAVF